jgi:Sigma 54 modulation protein / S30EA ribosomal protein
MQVLVNSDHHITGDESTTERVRSIVEDSLDRFADRVTRVEVFLSDAAGGKHGAKDKKCVMEARPSGLGPVAVSNEAPTILEAIEGAAAKLQRALGHTLGKHNASSPKGPSEADTATVEELEQLEKWQKERASRA